MLEIAPTPDTLFTRDDALLYKLFYTHNGHTNWRFPTRFEYYQNTTLVNCWDQTDFEYERNLSTHRVILVRDSDVNSGTAE